MWQTVDYKGNTVKWYETELIEQIKTICEKLGFHSLGYQTVEGVLESIGIDKSKVCTYCWTGKE